MEEIIINIKSPSWWFTGVFFIFIGLLISLLIKSWLPKLIEYWGEKIPLFARRLIRSIKLRNLRKLKSKRNDDVLVLREIIKAYTFMVLFFLSTLILIASLMGTSIDFEMNQHDLGAENKKALLLLMFITALPTYIFQTIFLFQSAFVKNLLRSRAKLRITKHLSRLR